MAASPSPTPSSSPMPMPMPMDMMMMPMTFTTAMPFQILWTSWNVATPGQYAWSFFVCIAFGLARHVVARIRTDFLAANTTRLATVKKDADLGAYYSPPPTSSLLDHGLNGVGTAGVGGGAGAGWLQRALACTLFQRSYFLLRLVDVLLFGAVATIGFLNMLIVMTYNPGIMMAIVIGEMIGVAACEPPNLCAPSGTGFGDATGHACH